MSDDFDLVRGELAYDYAREALDRIEAQLASLTEENERLRAIIEEDGCWGSREEARQALSPIDPPLVQEMKGP